jgi:hypothetical protein
MKSLYELRSTIPPLSFPRNFLIGEGSKDTILECIGAKNVYHGVGHRGIFLQMGVNIASRFFRRLGVRVALRLSLISYGSERVVVSSLVVAFFI